MRGSASLEPPAEALRPVTHGLRDADERSPDSMPIIAVMFLGGTVGGSAGRGWSDSREREAGRGHDLADTSSLYSGFKQDRDVQDAIYRW